MIRAAAGDVRAYLRALFRSVGMTREGARTMADSLIEADLRGLPGHGARLAPGYLAKLTGGRLNPRPKLTVVTESASSVALEGDLAPGPLAARAAVGAAVLRARGTGAAVVTVRRCGHAGALGVHASRPAGQGLICLLAAQTSSASVALHGGPGGPVLGNSAIALAVPGADPERPVLLDLAAGALSWGAVGALGRAGLPLLSGAALDAGGAPTTDPGAAAVLLPRGQGAGQGLSVILELLVGALTGSAPLPGGGDGRGLLCLVIDPARLGAAGQLLVGVRVVGDAVRAPGGARMPGDRTWARRQAAAGHIVLDDADMAALIAAGRPRIRAPARWEQILHDPTHPDRLTPATLEVPQ